MPEGLQWVLLPQPGERDWVVVLLPELGELLAAEHGAALWARPNAYGHQLASELAGFICLFLFLSVK